MRDYNHDGKVDHHDSSIFHNYINTSEDSGNNSSSPSGKMGGGTVGILIGILVVFEIVKSGIVSGPFAGLLAIGCLVGLFLLFGCWLESK